MKEGLRHEGPAGTKQRYVCFMMGERVGVGVEEALMIDQDSVELGLSSGFTAF